MIGLGYRHFIDPLTERSVDNYLRSALHAVLVALAAAAPYLALDPARLAARRRLPMWADIALGGVVLALSISFALVLGQALFYGLRDWWGWLTLQAPILAAVAIAAGFVQTGVLRVISLIGPRQLARFLIGRYRRPVRERRLVMFLDLAGSTALAERLGEIEFSALLTDSFADIDGAVADCGGEVMSYVGDALIVSWDDAAVRRQVGKPGALDLHRLASGALDARAEHYRRRYGATPRFRAAAHAGAVVIGECGRQRRQIAYFGDTMNVAARLQDHGKQAGLDFVLSREALTAGGDLAVDPIGAVAVRGRSAPVIAFAARSPDASVKRI